MMCADMTSERIVMDMLNKAKGYKFNGKSELQLTDAQGNVVALLQKRNGKMSESGLQGEWKILSADGMPAAGESTPTIWFDTEENLTHGNAGCNTFNGEYTVGKDHALRFGTMAVTMRMCDDMEFEQKFLQVLDQVATFGKLPNGNAGLFDENGRLLIELAR